MGSAVICGDDGQPVSYAEALITMAEYAALIDVVKGRENKLGDRTSNVSPLSRLVRCADCGGRVHSRGLKKNHGLRYQCENSTNRKGERICFAKAVDGQRLEKVFTQAFLHEHGSDPVPSHTKPEAIDHSGELADVQAQLDDLLGMMIGKPAAVKALYEKRKAALEARLETLAALPTPTGPQTVYGQQTYATWWAEKNWDERRRQLSEFNVHGLLATTGKGLANLYELDSPGYIERSGTPDIPPVPVVRIVTDSGGEAVSG